MSTPPVWMLRQDVNVAYEFGELLLKDRTVGVTNTAELIDAEHRLAVARGGSDDTLPLPYDFPAPRLGLPASGFAPDYFSFGSYYFCSHKFREVLCQPEAVVQYCPVELTSGGFDALAQDYRWFRILASQSAMDMQLSDCEVEQITSVISGKTITIARNIRRFVLPVNFIPATDIFRIAETLVFKMTADALAERLLRAGCTGMEFCHPEDNQFGMRVVHFRTADGVGERRVGFLD